MNKKQNIGRILLFASVPSALVAFILFFIVGSPFGYAGGALMLFAFIGSIISIIFTTNDTKVPLNANLITNGLSALLAFIGSILGVIVCASGVPTAIACGVIGFLLGLAATAFFIVCCIFKVRYVKHVVYKETKSTSSNN